MRGKLKRLRDVIGQQIFVFLCKACDVVNDVTRVVLYLKLWRVKLAGLLIVRVLVLLEIKLMHPAQKIFIGTSDRPFFVHKLEERGPTDAFGLEQFETTRAIFKGHIGDRRGAKFILVLVHFQSDHVLVKVLLQLLVGVVNADLLETVFLE